MKISGFTLVKNGCQFDYPFLESLESMLPLVDELIVNVGISQDHTLAAIKGLQGKSGNKIKIIERDWDPGGKKSGLLLSEQTNVALKECSNDWCLYLQADEVLHEEDRTKILTSLHEIQNRKDIDGLLFQYVHFYGSYNVVQTSRTAYRNEVRVIRKSSGAQSVGDAQSFRKEDGSKLRVIPSQAKIFHYGWVRTPEAMKEKTFYMDQLYHGEPTPENQASRTPHTGTNYQYKRVLGLREFEGSHPAIMSQRIQKKGWHWDIQGSQLIFGLRDIKKILLDSLERLTGYRFFEYRSYRLIK